QRASAAMRPGSARTTSPDGAGAAGAGGLPRSAAFWDFRPRTPWDLSEPDEREYFELLDDGLVVALEPAQDAPGAPWFSRGGAWLHYGVDGVVTAFAGKVEIGQDNRTALSLIVADELQVTPGDGPLSVCASDLFTVQLCTLGSRSLPGV